jgi:hypothetical protein
MGPPAVLLFVGPSLRAPEPPGHAAVCPPFPLRPGNALPDMSAASRDGGAGEGALAAHTGPCPRPAVPRPGTPAFAAAPLFVHPSGHAPEPPGPAAVCRPCPGPPGVGGPVPYPARPPAPRTAGAGEAKRDTAPSGGLMR